MELRLLGGKVSRNPVLFQGALGEGMGGIMRAQPMACRCHELLELELGLDSPLRGYRVRPLSTGKL